MSKKLMAFGIASPLLYVGVAVLGAAVRPEYSHLSNAVSELLLVGAPNRLLLSLGMGLSSACIVAGCIAAFKQSREMGKIFRFAVALLLFTGISGLFTALVWPQDPVGAPATFSGTMHIGLVAVAALCSMVAPVLVAIPVRQREGWRGLFWLSLICAGLALTFGALSPVIIALDIPLMGLFQRMTIASFFLWLIAFFVMLMKSGAISDHGAGGRRGG